MCSLHGESPQRLEKTALQHALCVTANARPDVLPVLGPTFVTCQRGCSNTYFL